MSSPDLRHEPAKENFRYYRPDGDRGFLCRLCHAHYANRALENPTDRPWYATLEGRDGGVCPAKLYNLLKERLQWS